MIIYYPKWQTGGVGSLKLEMNARNGIAVRFMPSQTYFITITRLCVSSKQMCIAKMNKLEIRQITVAMQMKDDAN